MPTIINSQEKIGINSIDSIDKELNPQPKPENSSLQRVIEITNLMGNDINIALDKINHINRKTEFLAINALIEASRTGDSGKGFQVVAESIDVLASKTKNAVEKMRKETISKMSDLCKIIENQSWKIQGQRFSDLALANMDLIDRNLFERAADIRWWATDDILVDALENKTEQKCNQACERLKIILKSYSVYFDIILLDEKGIVIANGLPHQFDIKGNNFSHKPWFTSVLKTKNGEQYGFQGVHRSSISGKLTITFSCKVHQDGDPTKPVIGFIASVLNWNNLAQRIVNETPLNEDEKQNSRICIIENDGTVVADTTNKILTEKINLQNIENIFKTLKGYSIVKQHNESFLASHGSSPGYEDYSSNMHCLIFTDIMRNES